MADITPLNNEKSILFYGSVVVIAGSAVAFRRFVATEETLPLLGSKTIKMIHKKWKPSELETAILKIHFQSNQEPNLDEQESILKNLKVKFNSQVRLAQLTEWFENERERNFNKPTRVCKNSYRKFQKEEIDYLAQSFSEDNYPKISTMIAMSKQMECSLSKIENWYKHHRRLLAQQGEIKFKARKYFKKQELNYLVNMFNVEPCPNKKAMTEIAENLNCDRYQIKNWYSNRRKKFRLLNKKDNCNIISSVPEPMQEIYMSSPESQLDEPYVDQMSPERYFFDNDLASPSTSDNADIFLGTPDQNDSDVQGSQEAFVPQNSLDSCNEPEISPINPTLSTEYAEGTGYTTSFTPPMPSTTQHYPSYQENQQTSHQIMPQYNQSHMSFSPFGNTMHQEINTFNQINTVPGGVILHPIPPQNMFIPYVHYPTVPTVWHQPVADAPFGSYAEPNKKIILMRAVPVNTVQNPMKFVVFY